MSLIEGVTSDQTELHEGNGYSPPPKIEAESPQIALIPEFSNLNSTLVPPWTVEADQLWVVGIFIGQDLVDSI